MILKTCIARGCGAGIPTQRLMCRVHWFMVPPATRRIIQQAPRGSRVHSVAIERAILTVAELESEMKIIWSGKLGGEQ